MSKLARDVQYYELLEELIPKMEKDDLKWTPVVGALFVKMNFGFWTIGGYVLKDNMTLKYLDEYVTRIGHDNFLYFLKTILSRWYEVTSKLDLFHDVAYLDETLDKIKKRLLTMADSIWRQAYYAFNQRTNTYRWTIFRGKDNLSLTYGFEKPIKKNPIVIGPTFRDVFMMRKFFLGSLAAQSPMWNVGIYFHLVIMDQDKILMSKDIDEYNLPCLDFIDGLQMLDYKISDWVKMAKFKYALDGLKCGKLHYSYLFDHDTFPEEENRRTTFRCYWILEANELKKFIDIEEVLKQEMKLEWMNRYEIYETVRCVDYDQDFFVKLQCKHRTVMKLIYENIIPHERSLLCFSNYINMLSGRELQIAAFPVEYNSIGKLNMTIVYVPETEFALDVYGVLGLQMHEGEKEEEPEESPEVVELFSFLDLENPEVDEDKSDD